MRRYARAWSWTKMAVLAATLAVLPVLSACWGIAPMDRRGVVVLLGIDAVPQSGYQVTASILNPLGQPNVQGVTAGGTPEIVRSASAATAAAALGKIRATSYLDLDFRHLKGVVVSEGVAEQGLAAPLDTMIRSTQMTTTPWLYVARGASAAAVLRGSQATMPNAGTVLEQTTEWSRALTPNYAERLFGFLEQMQVTGNDPVTGGVALDAEQAQPDVLAFRLAGVAMFQRDRLAGWLDGPAALGWLVGTGRAAGRTVVAPGPVGRTVTLQLVGDRRHIRVIPTPSGPQAELQVKVKARITAIQPGVGFWQGPGAVRAVQDASAGVLSADLRGALRAAQSAGADVFGLGQYVRVQDPSAWHTLQDDWESAAFERLPVAVQVQVTVNSVGRNVCPPFGPC